MDRDEEDLLTLSPKIRKKEDLMHTGPTGNILVSGETKSPKDCQESSGGEKLSREEMTASKGRKTLWGLPTTGPGDQKIEEDGGGTIGVTADQTRQKKYIPPLLTTHAE